MKEKGVRIMASERIKFEKLPDNMEEFISLSNLENPKETAALFVIAIATYVKDKDLGIEMINHLKGPEKLNPYGLQFLRDCLRDKPYLPNSYFLGTNPQNNYEPPVPYEVEVFEDQVNYVEGYERVLLQSSGADSKRLLVLRKKGNQYFVWDYPGILSGIRIPVKDDKWA